ncbi:MAG: hypothetical protein HXS46_11235 [Theionarchaea archaeon]|nr:MAG: hypothetical protein AYK18_01975 [Theionarchaea archaeon DG-70]MBU7011255.1 hypothetical protein [Theionarchaea archaeon]
MSNSIKYYQSTNKVLKLLKYGKYLVADVTSAEPSIYLEKEKHGYYYRQKVRLATKLPCWLIEKGEDFDRLIILIFTCYIRTMNELNVFDWAEQKSAKRK